MENQQKQYTPVELEKMEAEMTNHYNKKLPFLRLKSEHDNLLMEISEARIRTIQADHAFYQFSISQEEALKKAKDEKDKKGDKDGSH